MKIKLNRQFVSTLVEDLDLRNNDIILESVGYNNIDDITLFNIYIENLILLEDDKNKIFMKIINEVKNLFKQSTSLFKSHTEKIIKMISYNDKQVKNLSVKLKSIIKNATSKIKNESFIVKEDDELTKVKDVMEFDTAVYFIRSMNTITNIIKNTQFIDKEGNKVKLIDLYNTLPDNVKNNSKKGMYSLYMLATEKILIDNKTKKVLKKLLMTLYDKTNEFNEKYNNKKLNTKMTIKALSLAKYLNNAVVDIVNDLKSYKGELIYKIKKNNIKYIAQSTSYLKQIKQSENILTYLKELIKATFKVLDGEIQNLRLVLTGDKKEILNNLIVLLNHTRSTLLTGAIILWTVSFITYLAYLIAKLIVALIKKIINIFKKTNKISKSDVDSLKRSNQVYSKQLQQIKNKAKKEKQKNKK